MKGDFIMKKTRKHGGIFGMGEPGIDEEYEKL